MIRLINSAILAVAVAVVLATTLPAQEAKPKESPEQKAVREWLKENTHTGKFEEVKWYPVAQLSYDGKPSGRAIRLKYRTANQLGATMLYDAVFEFTGKRMIHHDPDHPIYQNREKIFAPKP